MPIAPEGRKAATASAAEHVRIRQAVKEVAVKIAGMLRHLPDTNIPMLNSQWTVGEAAAHLAETQGLFKQGLQGAKSPYGDGRVEGFANVNLHQLEHFSERHAGVLATMIELRTQEFLEASSRHRENFVIEYHFGVMDLTEWLSYSLTHLLMHSYPMAEALGATPPLEPAHSDLCLPFVKAVIPRVFDGKAAGQLRACYEFRIRKGKSFAVYVDRGKVTVADDPPVGVDCHISADPVAFFLVVLGVKSQWPLIARGKLLAWGRRPWLAFRFKKYFPNP